MKLLITGATGLIGKELLDQCAEDGIPVHFLTTRKNQLNSSPNAKGFHWNPKTGEIDTAAFNGITTIINLAGAPVSRRWTASYKKLIRDSRIDSIRLLRDTLQQIEHSISHFVSASGISYYPSSLSEEYSENHPTSGTAFLAGVTVDWETEADAIGQLGIKVSKLRTGIVLSEKGGALLKMVKPIKMGMGAPLGSGKQWQSWIDVTDMAAMYLHICRNELEGTFNAVAPNPITNAELTKAIASALGKRVWLPNVPAFVLKLVLGEMGSLVLESQKVSCQKIQDSGFEFTYPTITESIGDLL